VHSVPSLVNADIVSSRASAPGSCERVFGIHYYTQAYMRLSMEPQLRSQHVFPVSKDQFVDRVEWSFRETLACAEYRSGWSLEVKTCVRGVIIVVCEGLSLQREWCYGRRSHEKRRKLQEGGDVVPTRVWTTSGTRGITAHARRLRLWHRPHNTVRRAYAWLRASAVGNRATRYLIGPIGVRDPLDVGCRWR
jgi:hypothetical protein